MQPFPSLPFLMGALHPLSMQMLMLLQTAGSAIQYDMLRELWCVSPDIIDYELERLSDYSLVDLDDHSLEIMPDGVAQAYFQQLANLAGADRPSSETFFREHARGLAFRRTYETLKMARIEGREVVELAAQRFEEPGYLDACVALAKHHMRTGFKYPYCLCWNAELNACFQALRAEKNAARQGARTDA
jgi:hypothetical protein